MCFHFVGAMPFDYFLKIELLGQRINVLTVLVEIAKFLSLLVCTTWHSQKLKECLFPYRTVNQTRKFLSVW